MNKRTWLSVLIIIVMLLTLWGSAAFAADGGICPAGYTSIFNTNQIGCTFCAAPGCEFALLPPAVCSCSPGDVECCNEHSQCCTNCSEAGSLECTLNRASCETDCCFTECPPTPTPTATSTRTPTSTPTVTPTPTLLALGDPCVSGTRCASTFCAPDGVCCNAPCTAPAQSCTLPGSVGLCRLMSAAPALSPAVFVVVAVLLTAAGWLVLRRRARE